MASDDPFGVWISPTAGLVTGLEKTFPEIPDSIDALLGLYNGIVSYVQITLDMTLAFLDILKNFLAGLLDPITALIEAIISQIEDFLRDLRNVGIYIASDAKLLSPPFVDLIGGFSAYESRMIRRLLDKSDITRPDISSGTSLFAIFFYIGVPQMFGASSPLINKLVRFITEMDRFFNPEPNQVNPFLTPSDLKYQYYRSISDTFFSESDAIVVGDSIVPPTRMMLQWNLTSYSAKQQQRSFYNTPPSGFLIEISTVKDGLSLFYDVPEENTGATERKSGKIVDPLGKDFHLYGGYDAVSVSGVDYNENTSSSGGESVRVYAENPVKGGPPIPVSLLKDSENYYLQKQIYVSVEDMFSTGILNSPQFMEKSGYKFSLSVNDLPKEAGFIINNGIVSVDQSTVKIPGTVYVRISVVSDRVSKSDDWYLDATTPTYQSGQYKLSYGVKRSDTKVIYSGADKGPVSKPMDLNIPGITSGKFMNMIMTSLAVLVLGRSDLEVGSVIGFQDGKVKKGTGLELYSPLVQKILGVNDINSYFSSPEDEEKPNLLEFRNNLLTGITVVASDLYRRMGYNKYLEDEFVSRFEEILGWKWSNVITEDNSSYDMTILESLQSGYHDGISRNPYASGDYVGFNLRDPNSKIRISYSGDSDFYTKVENGTYGVRTYGSAEYSPGIYAHADENDISSGAEYKYCRDLIPDKIYSMAASILGVSASSELRPAEEGEWWSLRFFESIPVFETTADLILEWVRNLFVGAPASIVDALINYIEFLEARITEIQEFINKIDAIVALIVSIKIPIVDGLFISANGTDDLLARFVSSDNKPVDGINDYGGGYCMIFAGAPKLVVDLIIGLIGDFA